MNIQEITQRLQQGNITPHEAVEYRQIIAGWYSFYSQQLQDILVRKPVTWSAMRKNHKSDKACDQEWNATENGINEIGLAMSLKRCEKILSALKTVIDIANVDWRNTK